MDQTLVIFRNWIEPVGTFCQTGSHFANVYYKEGVLIQKRDYNVVCIIPKWPTFFVPFLLAIRIFIKCTKFPNSLSFGTLIVNNYFRDV